MLNFDNICRTCSLQGELQSLFVEDLLNPAEMLTQIVDIKVIKGDKYPQNICSRCLDSLRSSYIFKNQCLDAHKKFEQYLSQNAETIVDYKRELDNVFIKEESELDHSKTDDVSFELDNESGSNPEEKPYDCKKCNVQFKYQKNFERHLKKHDQLYICPSCGNKFPTRHDLEQHSQEHCKKETIPDEDCEKSFLQRPKKLKNVNKELFNPKVTVKKNFPQIKPKRKYLCDYCGRGYPDATKLNAHIRTHTGEKPFSCIECNKFFTGNHNLRQHRRVYHSNKKPYKCDFCEKSFAMSHWLKQHVRIHMNAKPFTCDICNQKFREKHHLTRHKLVHTGEKPFSCSVCDKQFTQKSNLGSHMRTHAGEKSYVCSICSEVFHDSNSLKNHRAKHVIQ
ncbi:zinc finger protein OZF-like isoform X2 [Chrysoperla carnea]|uniref:zinc finger protein OZF-like isoform X2 n=1 Tax=Chrysoperla carnea TaxID=189513 RepID=UPI001D088E2E|nr:zinc finger protein OZF-like isoform X2 [Chrysoperla carnea]